MSKKNHTRYYWVKPFNEDWVPAHQYDNDIWYTLNPKYPNMEKWYATEDLEEIDMPITPPTKKLEPGYYKCKLSSETLGGGRSWWDIYKLDFDGEWFGMGTDQTFETDDFEEIGENIPFNQEK